MWDAIGQTLPNAVVAAISPFPIIAVVLMLVTPHGKVNGLLYVGGGLVGLAIVGAIVLAIAGPLEVGDGGSPSTGSGVAQIVFGVLILLVALGQWRKRPRDGVETKSPKWMTAVDGFTPLKAAALGVFFGGVNPKNTLLAASAALTGIRASPASERRPYPASRVSPRPPRIHRNHPGWGDLRSPSRVHTSPGATMRRCGPRGRIMTVTLPVGTRTCVPRTAAP